MDLKHMVFPRHVTIGPGALEEIPQVMERTGMVAPVALATGPRTRELAGRRVEAILAKADLACKVVAVRAPTSETVDDAIAQARGCRSVVAVGGGSVIDAGKLLAKGLNVPIASVPTAASHDGIASPRVSLRDGRHRHSIEAPAPIAIVADTTLIARAPHRLTAAGVGDAMSNLSAVLDWQLAHRVRGEAYSDVASTLARLASETVLESAALVRPGHEPGVRIVVKGLILSGVGMGVAGSSRPASGAEHLISHALDLVAPGRALHGEQVGLCTILTLWLHGGPWARVRAALQEVGAPVTLQQLGVTRDEMLEAMTRAHTIRDRYTILGTEGLTREAAEAALEATGVLQGA